MAGLGLPNDTTVVLTKDVAKNLEEWGSDYILGNSKLFNAAMSNSKKGLIDPKRPAIDVRRLGKILDSKV